MDKNKQDKIQELEEKITELENSWKRALADYKNLEKRVNEERTEFIAFANQTLISKLIYLLDNLELVAKHSDDKGLEMVVKEFTRILDEEGVAEIKALDEMFDESLMDASEVVEGENGKVIEVVQKGYKLKNKVIRPATVKVGGSKEQKKEE